jgi:hypothetical protein
MNEFKPHNQSLVEFYDSIADSFDIQKLKELLDLDNADAVLRAVLPIEEMRAIGSFFTGQALSTKAIESFGKPISVKSAVLDPTCGTGNLLLECSRKLSIKTSLTETLKIWGRVLKGYDIHESFVEATKLRIILEALSRGAQKDCSLSEAITYLPDIKTRDAMSLNNVQLSGITHVIMNPPFSTWPSPETDYWNLGKVNAAGVIFDHMLRVLPSGCEISAILPDVLRSGSRYEKWRQFISTKLVGKIAIIGRFNKKTNVDVFIIDGTVQKSIIDKRIQWSAENVARSQIGDHFDVCIGPLVAYRDPQDGPLAPYAHSNNIPLWEITTEVSEKRKFKGRLITPPFVVVRRTSSPSNKFRAAGAIIGGTAPVAVENHLIVIKPKNGKTNRCKALLKALKCSDINVFINEKIRCRHLTVGVMKEIPFMDTDDE